MLIVVQYRDERFEMVIHYRLVELLEKGEVKGFSSPQGWVTVEAPLPSVAHRVNRFQLST